MRLHIIQLFINIALPNATPDSPILIDDSNLSIIP